MVPAESRLFDAYRQEAVPDSVGPVDHLAINHSPSWTAWGYFPDDRRIWRTEIGLRDGVKDTKAVLRRMMTAKRARALCSQMELTGPKQDHVVSRVLNTNLQGFSRHYQGLDGATVGFSFQERFPTVDEALDSQFTVDAASLLHNDTDVIKLLKYVYDNYWTPAVGAK
jgi:hypothetical protein